MGFFSNLGAWFKVILTSMGIVSGSPCTSLLTDLNQKFLNVHTPKEEAFWAQRMGLKNVDSSDLSKREIAVQQYVSNPSQINVIEKELERKDLAEQERLGLEGWLNFFKANAIEDAAAREHRAKVVKLETALQKKIKNFKTGYMHPETREFINANSIALRTLVAADPDERVRRAALEGLRQHERQVLENGFIEILKERRKLARMLGYSDYYDMKVNRADQMTKEELFSVLDDLETKTRVATKSSIERLVEEKGPNAVEAWNFDYYSSGDIKEKLDPYFPFENALAVWGKTFTALGVKYRNASVHVDLVNRQEKYPNGFMHAPLPPYVDCKGTFHPTLINMTSNAVPGQVSSGQSALATLLHEGGHTAHFSNIVMPSPSYSQEFAPTSMAFAETQSMFFDNLMEDADWLSRYGKTLDGKSLPKELIKEYLLTKHRFLARDLRWMMTVSYAEKALYEMSDSELTVENILSMLRKTEEKMLFTKGSGRPVLTVVHILEEISAASYHGYLLAQMAVYQTRKYFLDKYGYILDNPNIGPELSAIYWRLGNRNSFLEYLKDLTGKPFSAKATIKVASKPPEEYAEEIDAAIDHEQMIPKYTGPVNLDIRLYVDHGDERIASTEDGQTFEEVSDQFAKWIAGLKKNRDGN